MPQRIITGVRLATMLPGDVPYGLTEDAAIAVADGRIAWAGPAADMPKQWEAAERTDFGGRLATPALIDCHTHLVFDGDRAKQFERRLEGASYEEIARADGGIVSTEAATRALSEDALV